MTVLTPIYLFSHYYAKNKLYLAVVYTIIIFGFAKLIMSAPSSLNYRYKQTITHINTDGVNSNSSDPRKFIWKNALSVINNNWILGTGIGDTKKVLLNSYKLNIVDESDLKLLMDSTINSIYLNEKLVDYLKKKSIKFDTPHNYQINQYAKKILERRNNLYKTFIKRELNFHNQYFQVFGTIGIFGVLLLVYLFFVPLYIAIKKGHYLFATFLFIVGASFLTESMLERQAGVSFIVFFFMILVASKYQNKPS